MTTTPDSSVNRQWLKITLLCPQPLLEATTDLMGVLSGVGVEQGPETPNGALISGFFLLEDFGEKAEALLARVDREMAELFALYDSAPPTPQSIILADQDWATSWQQYFKPFEIVPDLVIKPSWEAYQLEPGQCLIEMDPGMAFGTGQHASTRMALALICKSMATLNPRRVLDVGTGTGILAMAAALFGASNVVAIDNDPDAVTVASENITKNRLDSIIATSATPVEHIQGPFNLICANIVHDVLVAMAPVLTGLTALGGHLVLAGILAGEQEANIVRVYQTLGAQTITRQHQEEWVALLLERAPASNTQTTG